MNNFSYLQASSPDEVFRALGSGGDVRILAGGTDLIPLIKDRIYSPETVVDITSADGLDEIEEVPTGLTIGALTTLSTIAHHPLVRERYSALADACNLAASPQLRNMGTIGGNLLQQTRCWYFRGDYDCWMKGGAVCYARDGENENHAIFMTRPSESKCVSAHPSDPGAALLALDAVVLISTPSGPLEMAVGDFFARPTDERRTYTNLPAGALITGIRLPERAAEQRSSYTKAMARATWAFALAGIAISVDLDGARIRNARVALTGVAPIPFRVESVERQISASQIADLDYEALARRIVADAAPLAHNGYKVDLLGAIFRQALADLLK